MAEIYEEGLRADKLLERACDEFLFQTGRQTPSHCLLSFTKYQLHHLVGTEPVHNLVSCFRRFADSPHAFIDPLPAMIVDVAEVLVVSDMVFEYVVERAE